MDMESESMNEVVNEVSPMNARSVEQARGSFDAAKDYRSVRVTREDVFARDN